MSNTLNGFPTGADFQVLHRHLGNLMEPVLDIPVPDAHQHQQQRNEHHRAQKHPVDPVSLLLVSTTMCSPAFRVRASSGTGIGAGRLGTASGPSARPSSSGPTSADSDPVCSGSADADPVDSGSGDSDLADSDPVCSGSGGSGSGEAASARPVGRDLPFPPRGALCAPPRRRSRRAMANDASNRRIGTVATSVQDCGAGSSRHRPTPATGTGWPRVNRGQRLLRWSCGRTGWRLSRLRRRPHLPVSARRSGSPRSDRGGWSHRRVPDARPRPSTGAA